jgi:radical SAM superfamily enzyme YgiQ (UPF0313 family)/ubiquinone/menaquinone biosynthesis C-methylase UbiE
VIIRDINRSGRSSREEMIWPQTSLAYLAAVLKAKYSVKIIDCIAEGWDWSKFKEYLARQKARYVVTNIITATLSNDIYTAVLAKGLGAKTIGIGPHVTSLPKETLQAFSDLDLVIRGEAELTVKELVDCCERKDDLTQIRGIAFRDDGKVIVTEERPFLENLDLLPLPAHELLPLGKYYRPFFGNYTFIITSRGCPFNCSFCRQSVMWKGKFRQRSVDSVIAEIKYLKELGLSSLLFHADTFTVNKEWVIRLCKKIIADRLNIRWACNTHVATIDEETAGWMKESGCWMIAPGIESSSQAILDNVNKGSTIPQVRKAVDIIHNAGIEVWGYFVLGLPGETKETLKQTINFSKQLPLDMANFAIGAPYPGTKFFDQAKTRGWFSTGLKWEDFDQNSLATVSYEGLTARDIEKSLKAANLQWFLRPGPVLKILKESFKTRKNFKIMLALVFRHLKWFMGIRGRKGFNAVSHQGREIILHKKLAQDYRYRYSFPFSEVFQQYWNDEIMQLLPYAGSDLRVLELGCGTGLFLKELSEKFDSSVGLDISYEMLEGAEDDSGRRIKKLVNADALDLPFGQECFDIVVCRGSLHHVVLLDKALLEIRRVLKKRGLLIFSEPSDDCILIRLARKVMYTASKSFNEEDKAFLTPELRSVLRYNKFKIEELKRFGFLSYLFCGFPDRFPVMCYVPFGRSLCILFKKIDKFLSGLPCVKDQSFHVIVKARKEQ